MAACATIRAVRRLSCLLDLPLLPPVVSHEDHSVTGSSAAALTGTAASTDTASTAAASTAAAAAPAAVSFTSSPSRRSARAGGAYCTTAIAERRSPKFQTRRARRVRLRVGARVYAADGRQAFYPRLARVAQNPPQPRSPPGSSPASPPGSSPTSPPGSSPASPLRLSLVNERRGVHSAANALMGPPHVHNPGG